MREYTINDPLGKITVSLPDKHCAFCKNCIDVFYDYTNGPYLYLCCLSNNGYIKDECADFDDIEGE